ncbi:MAG TPA: paraquat-inducible protein A [Opitutaceae bacterium]|nr:paraquat-inducible protein A [Opitutaceae bacterium]
MDSSNRTENRTSASRNVASGGGLRSCPNCDLLLDMAAVPATGGLRCPRCTTALARGSSRLEIPLAFALTAIVLYLAALNLPFATAAKFGEAQTGYLFSGVATLWSGGYQELAILVVGCGLAAPLILNAALTVILVFSRKGLAKPVMQACLRIASWVEKWSMPEVQMLAVIVAFTKISTLVETRPGAGLWLYGAAAFFTLLAWRRFDASVFTAAMVRQKFGGPS